MNIGVNPVRGLKVSRPPDFGLLAVGVAWGRGVGGRGQVVKHC